MDHRSSSQTTKKHETSEQQSGENLTYTKYSGTSAQRGTSNQKTKETPTPQKSEEELIYTVDTESVTHKERFITMTNTTIDPELISVCGCLISGRSDSIEETAASLRKRRIFSSVQTVETYLRERRILELVRFIITKIMCKKPRNVAPYVSELLDKCMCFRAGYGPAPVLFEERHLEAVIKSFDPSNRGWLSAGQVRRALMTLGLTPKSDLKGRIPTSEALNLLRETQERELFSLLTAGCEELYFL